MLIDYRKKNESNINHMNDEKEGVKLSCFQKLCGGGKR